MRRPTTAVVRSQSRSHFVRRSHLVVHRPFALLTAFLTVVGVTVIALPPSVASASTIYATVTPSTAWVDSTLAVTSGTFYTVTATGTISGMSGAPGTPGGTPWSSCGSSTSTSVSPGLACGSLIGRIGSGVPFTIGSSLTFEGAPGELYLGINEASLTGLSGTWSVTINTGSPTDAVLASQRFGGGGGIAPGTCSDCAAGGSVDPATGDLIESASDTSVPTIGPSLALSRTYDSSMAQSEASTSSPGPFGYGWTDNFAMSLLLNRDYGATVSGDCKRASKVATLRP